MKRMISCSYNMDTSCVEARFTDGTMIAVDCRAVETALDADTWQRSELDWRSTISRWSICRPISAERLRSMSRDRRNIG